jgi:hypothetical protein
MVRVLAPEFTLTGTIAKVRGELVALHMQGNVILFAYAKYSCQDAYAFCFAYA